MNSIHKTSVVPTYEELQAQLAACEHMLEEERRKSADLTNNANRLIGSQSKLQALLHHASEGMIILNADGTVQSFNRASERIFKYAEIELLYQKIDHLFPGTEHFDGDIFAYLRKIAAAPGEDVYYGRRGDGSYVPIRVAVNEVMSNDMTLFGDNDVFEVQDNEEAAWTLCVVHDMTLELRIQSGLREQAMTLQSLNNAMAEANSQKTFFLSNVGHELRTPINGILGMTQILRTFDLPMNLLELVVTLQHSGERLKGIVEDILFVTQGGELHVDYTSIAIRNFLAEAVSDIERRAQAKNLKFIVEIEEEVPPSIVTDAQRLRTSLLKLLDNALKFTEAGAIHVTSRLAAADAGNDRLLIDVVDTGTGIDEAHLEQLFTPFYQVDPSFTRRAGGVGLGLSVAKQCLETMGARLEVNSRLGQGSRFTVSLPLQQQDTKAIVFVLCDSEKISRLRVCANNAFNEVVQQIVSDVERTITAMTSQMEVETIRSCIEKLDQTVHMLGADDLRRRCEQLLRHVEAEDDEAAAHCRLVLTSMCGQLGTELKAAASQPG